jgi:hypothetical protein
MTDDPRDPRREAEAALNPERPVKPVTRMRGIGWALLDIADAIRDHAAATRAAAPATSPITQHESLRQALTLYATN